MFADQAVVAVPRATISRAKVDSRVTVACVECVRAKMRCSHGRPCTRCIRRGHEDKCVDREPTKVDGKKRRRKQVQKACVPCK